MSTAQAPTGMAQARQRWRAMPARERMLVGVAAALIALALLWWIALGPALATLRNAPGQHQRLDTQLLRMRALQAEAKTMQSQPRQSRDDAQRALEASVRDQLGGGSRVVVAGDRATVTLAGVRGEVLAQWLTQARVNARAIPSEARLNRTPNGVWDGTLVLTLPAR